MSSKILSLVVTTLISVGAILPASIAKAQTPINWAEVVKTVREVKIRTGNSWRGAKRNDRLQRSGDELETRRSSSADLKLNEGSVVRMRSNSYLQFTPGTRNFVQNSGTVLYLIKPGQGQTNVRTKNGTRAGIRGSALFIRVIPETDTTIVGALTNSEIEVSANEKDQGKTLKAGQMAVVNDGQISLFEFDLRTFYQTSELVKGLNLDGKADPAAVQPDIQVQEVQAETLAAVAEQKPVEGKDVVTNPTFLSASGAVIAAPTEALLQANNPTNLPAPNDLTVRQDLNNRNRPASALPPTPAVTSPTPARSLSPEPETNTERPVPPATVNPPAPTPAPTPAPPVTVSPPAPTPAPPVTVNPPTPTPAPPVTVNPPTPTPAPTGPIVPVSPPVQPPSVSLPTTPDPGITNPPITNPPPNTTPQYNPPSNNTQPSIQPISPPVTTQPVVTQPVVTQPVNPQPVSPPAQVITPTQPTQPDIRPISDPVPAGSVGTGNPGNPNNAINNPTREVTTPGGNLGNPNNPINSGSNPGNSNPTATPTVTTPTVTTPTTPTVTNTTTTPVPVSVPVVQVTPGSDLTPITP